MSRARIALLARREVAEVLRSRWFLVYAALFFAGGTAFAVLGAGQGLGGGRISLRALVGLMHVLVIVVPPMAMLPAIALHADDDESGFLEYLLAQPVDRREIFLGKWAGAAAGITLAVLLGLLPGVVGALLRGAPADVLGVLLALTLLLGVGFATVGLALAAVTAGRGRATAAAVVLWLVLVVLGSLGMMAAFVRVGVPEPVILGWSVANPVEAFRLGILSLMDPDLSLFGPSADALLRLLGTRGLVAAAFGCLLGWTGLAGLVGLGTLGRPR